MEKKKNSFSDITKYMSIYRFSALNILGKMNFLLIFVCDFFRELKCNGMTSFMYLFVISIAEKVDGRQIK